MLASSPSSAPPAKPVEAAPAAPSGAIVDNYRTRRVGDVLQEEIAAASDLSFVSAYFTIYAYQALRDTLEAAGRTRFLYGDPQGVSTVDPVNDQTKAFRLTDDGGIELRSVLAQKSLAKACAAWIERQVDIRTIAEANLLHGKLYHVGRPDGTSAALLGSSNFTRRGLGLGSVPNIELNTQVHNADERHALYEWFNALWEDHKLTRDAKQEVLAALARLGAAYAPEFVYYKTLYHIFQERLAERGEREGLLQDVHLYDTAIWKALYEFQRDGATNAINRLLRHNGCIVADSVGLGKTWTALAVIKFFEARNERVLVLCPKRLEQNWVRYTSRAAYRNNPFEEDRLGYTVLAHTDLSRYEGKAGDIDLARFNWSAFDLIVIDESHNFRNEGRDRKDDAGNVIRHSRYHRLLEEVVKGGVHSKVLLLSATPVNTTLRDLRNQVYLMTEKRQDAFRGRARHRRHPGHVRRCGEAVSAMGAEAAQRERRQQGIAAREPRRRFPRPAGRGDHRPLPRPHPPLLSAGGKAHRRLPEARKAKEPAPADGQPRRTLLRRLARAHRQAAPGGVHAFGLPQGQV